MSAYMYIYIYVHVYMYVYMYIFAILGDNKVGTHVQDAASLSHIYIYMYIGLTKTPTVDSLTTSQTPRHNNNLPLLRLPAPRLLRLRPAIDPEVVVALAGYIFLYTHIHIYVHIYILYFYKTTRSGHILQDSN